MPRIRTIKPKFWDDEKIAQISRDARLTYIGLWNFADDLGVVSANPVGLKSKLFPYDHIQIQQFERWLAELQQLGFISLFMHKNMKFYYLPNFLKHQVINRPNYEEVNVKKEELLRLLNPKHVFTDESLNGQGRSGEEGKGEEEERKGGACARPTLQEVIDFFKEKGKPEELARKAFEHYATADWHDSDGKEVKSWKQKMLTVWINTENTQHHGKTNNRHTGGRLAPTAAAPSTGGYGKL